MKLLLRSLIVMKLKPIETAPKDGTIVIIFGGNAYGEVGLDMYNAGCVAEYTYGTWHAVYVDQYSVRIDNPTHWCELPEVPECL